MKKLLFITRINIFVNFLLTLIKATVGIIFSSVSLISDAINSLGDVLTAVIIHFTVKINDLGPDENHQFGHSRAENIAGYTIGILMIILAIQIIKYSIEKFFSKEYATYSPIMIYVVLFSIITKLFLYLYTKTNIKNKNSPALEAIIKDHLNDILILFGILIGIIALKAGYPQLDIIFGLLISILILITGIKISYENIKHLMGIKPDLETLTKIKNKALEIKEVISVNKIFSQYLGNKIQTEIHIVLDKKTPLKKAHDIGNKVRNNIEELDEIIKCFVHINSN
ncbi:MAG: cation diffusion facilitator family transporter [bacterium]